jgi:integrase/recombinase XerD
MVCPGCFESPGLGLYSMLRRRSHDAGVKTPGPHSFRRAFAILSLRGGMDIYSLQRLMGHETLDVLRRYLAQTEHDLQAAHQKSGPIDHLKDL